ncbi:type I restriction-modification system endonuclease [Comamonas composti]|uniref:type I restriction-modification system endonuclease n=1 Tax=Comamonas composti TaxID=408558 RepID=UPI0004163BD7|nr:type I restriction-modification system endonuclease [Comamonas composti]
MGSSNFSFLAEHSQPLADLGATAEKIFPLDPTSCVFKLRLLAEAITKEVALRIGVSTLEQTQAELLRTVDARLGLEPQLKQMLHVLRRRGNEVAHEVQPSIGYKEALDSIRIAREVALWFHRSFGSNPDFRPGPFTLPDDPSQKLLALQKQIAELQAQVEQAQQPDPSTMEALQAQLQAQAEQERALAAQAQHERDIYAQLAQEASDNYARLKTELEQAQAQASTQAPSSQQLRTWTERSNRAASQVHMDERSTRLLIDQMLRDAGWQTDSEQLSHAKGARPQRGQNLAIAEWPVSGAGGRSQRADYVLFAGLMPLAVIEAKRQSAPIASSLAQAERYARGMSVNGELQPAWQQPWSDGQGAQFFLPFAYACNGRPFVRQWAESSGTWFRDLRQPSNLARPLPGFHSAEGLQDLLRRDVAKAQQLLTQEATAYLQLRDYQLKAIAAVEQALAQGRTQCLLAMATGTGKTRTVIGLIYRLLKTERFRRILFLVDRTALGEQTQDSFDDMLLEQNQPLSSIYNIAELGDMAPQAATRVQVATVQAMVKRVFASDAPPGIDTFDCIIVDEAHRGYTLDQEMSEAEAELRDQAQYLSTYRRVLDYFDAVKIGLTATPAKHTSDIFGKPVYTYSYREAVADDWLIDYEPPITMETQLSRHGIHFDKGEQVESVDLSSGEIDVAELDDELHFDLESFNRSVITESFNRVICEQLAQAEITPFGEEKTLIFCATDAHADMVKRLLDEAFKAQYGEQYNQAAVAKITGSVDNASQLIRRYKNEALPSIAITVDLLSTGIDVPAICHLVFLRRVKSRILFEQMMGRATRRCDPIGKTVFKIYDPVKLFATLQRVNTMQASVKNPQIGLDQLLDELANPRSRELPGAAGKADTSHADDLLTQLGQRLMRVLRRAEHAAQKKPALKTKLSQLQEQWGVAPAELHRHLHALKTQQGTQAAVQFLQAQPRLLQQIGEVQELMGTGWRPVIAGHEDRLLVREQSWGSYPKPEDYLDSFTRFVQEQLNQSVALSVVVNRPRELTREQLREVRLLLDGAGYGEASLKAAWRNQSNQDITAGIVAYIRRAALGEPLLSFEERVNRAMQRIYALQAWTSVQRQWLDRIARQLKHETVIDESFLNTVFAPDGGTPRVDKLLGGQLQNVVNTLAESLWSRAA